MLAEWRGKIEVAAFRARDRLGAKARTHKALRDALPNELTNDKVPGYLGLQTLESAGVDAAAVVSESLLFLGTRSCEGDNFVDALTEHVLAGLDIDSVDGLDDERLTFLLQGVANPAS